MFTQITAKLRDRPEKVCYKMKGWNGPYYWMTNDEMAEFKRGHPVIAYELTTDLDDDDVRNLNKNPNVVISTKGLLAQLFG